MMNMFDFWSKINLFSIKVEDCLALPVHVYLKDKKGIYRECNAAQAKSFGLNDGNEALGKMDQDFIKEKEALILQHNERLVWQDEKSKIIAECATFRGSVPDSMISIKIPIRNQSGVVIGVLGLSFPTNEMHFSSLGILAGPALPSESAAQSLSDREKQCVYYLVRGKTAKEIAKVLNLSPRTIEFYVGRLKVKWGCRKTTELVSKILQASDGNEGGLIGMSEALLG